MVFVQGQALVMSYLTYQNVCQHTVHQYSFLASQSIFIKCEYNHFTPLLNFFQSPSVVLKIKSHFQSVVDTLYKIQLCPCLSPNSPSYCT